MTLTELRHLIALAQEKHFGKAAARCHVTQPTLSVSINKLESTLGVKIFERHHNSLRVTATGEKIVEQTQRALAEINIISEIAKSGKMQLNTPLKIGGIYTVAPYLFPLLIPKIHKLAPAMPLIVQEDFTANLRMKLQQGELDAIFIALPFKEKGVVTKDLYQEQLVALMRKDHHLSHKKSIGKHDLEKENLLLLGAGHCFREQVLKICPRCDKGENLQKTIEGTSLETLRHMVASGLGITILPSSATQVQHYKSILCAKPFTGKVPQRTIALAWRSSFPRLKAIDVIIKALSDCTLNGVCLLTDL